MSIDLNALHKKEKFIEIVCLDDFIDNLSNFKDLNLISIRSAGIIHKKKYSKIDEMNLPNIFTVHFDDIIVRTSLCILPSYQHIKSILNWAVKKYTENQNSFVVHCTAGVSRSSAVALLITQAIKGNGFSVINPDLHSPNLKILEYGEKLLKVPHLVLTAKQINKEWNAKFIGSGGVVF